MSPSEALQQVDERSGQDQLIIVSNREPYVHKRSGLRIIVEMPAGGLTSALDDVLRAEQGTWVAWGNGNADRDTVDMLNCLQVPPDSPRYTLKRVWLQPQDVDNYYHGYANQVLWPLCHITLDRVTYRRSFWRYYERVNQAFAKAVLEAADERSLVWLHDYHLCLLPRMLRDRSAGLTLAHFWHIPWPNWGVFRICPQAKEIIEGLLGNDLIGFQIPMFVRNFLDCVKECLEADVDYSRQTVTYRGRITALKAFPISIDYEKFNTIAASRRTETAMRDIRKKYGLGSYVGVGVDRLEYTKALLKRLQALSLFFERYEKFRRKFTFIQIAVPTRMKEPYLSYQKAVEEYILKINEKFGTPDWRPIIYIDTKVEHKDLAAYYRMSDIAVISSIYDGMNLVAKEYVASQVDMNGALILSEFAGAAEELDGAVLVNPYDIEEFSSSLRKALTMPQSERQRRMGLLRKHVREHDIDKWIHDVLHEIVDAAERKKSRSLYLFEHQNEFRAALSQGKLFLFLDFDGTLAPIAESPDKAVLSPTMHALVVLLKDQIPVAIVSGRGVDDVRQRVGIEDIVYAGNHGSEIWSGGQAQVRLQSAADRLALEELLRRLNFSLSHIPGVLVEDKGVTASIHYRTVAVKNLADFSDLFDRIVRDYEKIFRITPGKKVMEIKPLNAWNKGDAVSWILENMGGGRVPVYIGDDVTDEDAFRVLKGRGGVSISVGGSVHAEYYLRRQDEVEPFLESMVSLIGTEVPARS
jgi:trehalose 6-phosphate synthase/phosphatase